MTTFDEAFNHKILNDTLDMLTKNLFFQDNNIEERVVIPEENIKQSAWLASLLSLSPEEAHMSKALSFAILALQCKPENKEYRQFCYIIFSRIGNLPQTKHIEGIVNSEGKFDFDFDSVLNLELGAKKALGTIRIYKDDDILATDFQTTIWRTLESCRYISISGPTSSGKSFIIQSYIVDQCIKREKFKAVYIVPTRALISEVSAVFRKQLPADVVRIRTGIGTVDKEEVFDKEIFVLTPERSLRLIQLDEAKKLSPDIVFFDEIQNMEEPERGVILEHDLTELSGRWKDTKFVIAGPYLEKLERTLDNLGGEKSKPIMSALTSVFQMKVGLQFSKKNPNDAKVKILSPSGSKIETQVPMERSLYASVKGSGKGEALSVIIGKFGKNSINLVYSNSQASSEKWARDISATISSKTDGAEDPSIKGLCEYLQDEVHPQYSLIDCLQKGVAFHHAGLPDVARLEIEDLYRDGKISNLVCTSTLLQGVNLPAEKLFIITPNIDRSHQMENFEFGNLIGRAGRISSHLYGSIYCVDIQDEPWAMEKLDANVTKEVIPATTKALSSEVRESLISAISKPSKEIEDGSIAYTVVLLRQKYLKNKENVVEYLRSKEVPQLDIDKIMAGLSGTLDSISLSDNIIKLNPTIDPLLQNELYLRMKKEGTAQWLIKKNPMDSSFTENSDDLDLEDKNFYSQFEAVTLRLDEVFDFSADLTKSRKYGNVTARLLVRYAVPWIRGKNLKWIIENDLKITRRKKETYQFYQTEGTTFEDQIRIKFPEIPIELASSIAKMRKKDRIEGVPVKKAFFTFLKMDSGAIYAYKQKSVDSAIREVMRKINDLVRFQLVKYYKVWADILGTLMTEEEIKDYGYILNLNQMLEMGSCNPKELEIMSEGISRSIALKISKNIPKDSKISATEWLRKNRQIKLPNILSKQLSRQGFLQN